MAVSEGPLRLALEGVVDTTEAEEGKDTTSIHRKVNRLLSH
jgi:hypothetical protein